MGHHDTNEPTPRRRLKLGLRPGPALWIAGALSAALLVLGANGTLASWTQAIINNTTNTVATGTAVILQETSGANTCTSSTSDVSNNSATCATINKYGGTAVPLVPGASQVVNVTFKNIGQSTASSFVMTPGTCTSTPAVPNLCTNGDLTVAVSCSAGATLGTPLWTDLAYPAAAPPLTANAKTHTATGTELNANATWTCQFTITLAANAPFADQGITVSQPITWTLNK